ncbi:MAG TPA: membrane protein insertion efficiency factor YidD [Desulfobacteraceae bacterium]|nr:membrane protein insertion efficiency factor YidD [Desulfobacteraceae bacterium]
MTVVLVLLAGCAARESTAPRAGGVLYFYQKHLSPVDGDRCSMYPTCSGYAAETFKKHGFPVGWIMTCDRLLRCGRDEVKRSPVLTVKGRTRCYDPVAANDFWWYR